MNCKKLYNLVSCMNYNDIDYHNIAAIQLDPRVQHAAPVSQTWSPHSIPYKLLLISYDPIGPTKGRRLS